ncbi:hypothetical protein TNCV_1200761 [Trichonephila clavipes]|nr:hypothetical protein TNCV_1200761 [Trichonephila clavipes]
MKEGLIALNYECSKCNERMGLYERKSAVLDGDFEWVCSTITSQNIYGRTPMILLTMRPSRLFVKIRCHAVASTRKRSAVRKKVDKLVKLEEKHEILQETFKITEKRLVEKEIECASLIEKILIVNALTESNDHPKTSMSTKEREIKSSKRKTKKLKSSGRNANKTSDGDENQALAKEKNYLLRQIDLLNSIILDTKLKEPKRVKLSSLKKVSLQHFGFFFAVVSSLSGWPIVKLMALRATASPP